MSYDIKCEQLARVFLSDFELLDAERSVRIGVLAQLIQDAIESYIDYEDLKERT